MHIIEQLTACTEDEAAKRLRWLAASPRETQVEAMKLKNDLFHQLRPKHKNVRRAELELAVLIQAIHKLRQTRELINTKQPDHDLRKIGKAAAIQVDDFLARRRVGKRNARKPRLKDKIMQSMGDIRLIREKGGSWRAVAEFLEKKRRLKCHWTYVQRIYREIGSSQEAEK